MHGRQLQRVDTETVFTFIAVPDTQRETNNSSINFSQRMQWLADNRAALNIRYVVQNGDLTDWDTSDHIHFVRADAGLQILDAANIPYALSVGNHDTAAVQEGGGAAPGNVNANLRNTSTWNSFFPPSRYPYIDGLFETGKTDNAYRTFYAGGLNWLVMNLELWPRPSVYPWADSIIKAHPRHNVVIVTHMFLESNSTISTSDGGYGDTSPQTMYTSIIRDNPNVKFTFSGHVGTWGYRESTSTTDSHKTYHILDCWHDGSSNPTRLLTFNIPARSVTSVVYNPLQNTYRSGSEINISNIDWVR